MIKKILRSPTWEPIVKSAGVASVNRLFSIGIRLITVPLLINHLGTERFGLWLAISAVSGYVAMLDMGIGSAMINKLTVHYSRDERDQASSCLTSVLAFLCTISFIGILLTFLCIPLIDWTQLFKLKTEPAIEDVNLTIIIAAVVFFLQIPFSLIQKIPYTMQKGYICELHTLFANVIGLLGMLIGVYLQVGLPLLVVFINSSMIFAPIGVLVHLKVKNQIGIKYEGIKAVVESVKSIRKKGFHFIVMQATGTLMLALPFSMIAYYHGAAAVAPFGLLFQVLMAFQIPLTVFLQPMWTKMTELVANNKIDEVRGIFSKYLKAALLYSVVTTLCFIFVLNPVLLLLLNKNIPTDFYLRILFATWCSLGLICGGGVGAVILAMGLTRQISKISMIQLGVFIVVAMLLIPLRGASGAVESIIISYAVATPVLFLLIRSRLYSKKGTYM